MYIYSFLSPHSAYTYFYVCISTCFLPHVSVWASVLWCSQPPGTINQQRGRHCSTERDFTAPREWWLSLPASFPSFSPVSHSLTPSRMSPVVITFQLIFNDTLSTIYGCMYMLHSCILGTSWSDKNMSVIKVHICITCVLHSEGNPRMHCNELSEINKSKMVTIRNYLALWQIGG